MARGFHVIRYVPEKRFEARGGLNCFAFGVFIEWLALLFLRRAGKGRLEKQLSLEEAEKLVESEKPVVSEK